ncbi:MAG TPA: hypothetical protein VE988_05810 [Gemmataceae bacterium]|nr:hypothetical protein [Gemmataceae bacterium]
MQHCTPGVGRLLAGLAVIVAAGRLVAPVSAQQQIGTSENTGIPFTTTHKDRYEALREYKTVPDAAKDKALLEVAGRYLVGRVTWPGYQKWDSSLKDVYDEFNKLMDSPATKKGTNQEFMKLLAPELIANFSKILLDPDSHARDFKNHQATVTNAALLLPVLAKCKQNAVHEFLLKLVETDKDGKPVVHPFIRMCAIKAMGELNNPGGPELDSKDNFQQQEKKRDRELARLEAIVKFIDQPYPPEGTGAEYDNAYRYVRREGVKALAQLRKPIYEIKKGTFAGPVAFHLLKIASGSPAAVGPPYSLSERLEAVIGIAQLETAGVKIYNNELAVYVVANVLIDMASAYGEDFPIFSAVPKGKDGPQAILPWKYYAGALEEVLPVMSASLKNTPAAKSLDEKVRTNIKDVMAQMKVLRKIESPQVLQTFVANNPPAVNEVYLGNKDSALPLGQVAK